jgi:hypothetical protein
LKNKYTYLERKKYCVKITVLTENGNQPDRRRIIMDVSGQWCHTTFSRSPIYVLARRTAALIEVYHGFPQSVHENTCTVPLPSTFLPVYKLFSLLDL